MSFSLEPSTRPSLRLALFIFVTAGVAAGVWALFLRPSASVVTTAPAAASAEAAPSPAVAQVNLPTDSPGQPPPEVKARSRAKPPAAAEPSSVTTPPPVTAPVELPKQPALASPAPNRAPPPAAPPVSETTYDAGSAGVVPPALLTPTVNPLVREDSRYTPGSAAIEIIVNHDGSVRSVKAAREPTTIGESLEMVNGLSITKSWRFDPALRNGQPVKYRLLVPLSVLAVGRKSK